MNLKMILSTAATVMVLSSCGGGEGGGSSPNSGSESSLRPLTFTSDNESIIATYTLSIPELVLGLGRASLDVTDGLKDISQATLQETCDVSGEVTAELNDENSNNTFDAGEVVEIEYSNCRYFDDPTSLDGSIRVSAIDVLDNSQQLLMNIDVLVTSGEVARLNGQVAFTFNTTDDEEVAIISGERSQVTVSVSGIDEEVNRIGLTSVIKKSTGEYNIDYNFAMNSEALDGRFTCSTSTSMKGTTFSFPYEYRVDCAGANSMSFIKSDSAMPMMVVSDIGEEIGYQEFYFSDGSLFTPLSPINPKLVESIEKSHPDISFGSIFAQTNENKNILLVATNETLYKFNLTSLELVSQIPLGNTQANFNLSEDGSKLFISNHASGSSHQSSVIDIYDVDTLVKIRSVDLFDQYENSSELRIVDEKSIFPIESGDKWLAQYVYLHRQSNARSMVIAYYENGTFLTSVTRESSFGSLNYGGLNYHNGNVYFTDSDSSDALVTFYEYDLSETAITLQREVTSSLRDVEGYRQSVKETGNIVINNGKIYSQHGWVFDLDSLEVVDSFPSREAAYSFNTNRMYDLHHKMSTYSLSTGYKLREVADSSTSTEYTIRKAILSENSVILFEANTIKRIGKYSFRIQ